MDCLTGILNAVADRINKIKNDSGIEIGGFDTEKFILCYNLLQVFLSLIFALMRVRNMREKDITQGKV